MFKRIWLLLLTNLAVIILLNIVILIIERYLGIKLVWALYILVLALVIWFWWAFISLYISKWMAKKAYNITIIKNEDIYKLDKKEKIVWNTVQDLAERNHIEMPEVGIYKDNDPNAFATWATKNSSIVAVSTGLLEHMDEKSIKWVIWHEMAHILNWDMITMILLQWVLNTFVIFFARIVANIISNFLDENLSWIAYFAITIMLEIIFWILASFIAMWFSRNREFKADLWSAKFLWKENMIAWLEALKNFQHTSPKSRSKLATMKISTRKQSWIRAFLSSHPSLDDRIKRLENAIV